MAPDFWKIGASGRCYTVRDVLEKRAKHPAGDAWKTSEFRCQQLAQDLYLLTSILIQDHERKTLRSSIWRHTADR
jgi:hypothetical protein